MLKNPCLSCALLHEDKNNDKCSECNKRTDYIKLLEQSNYNFVRSEPKPVTKICTNIKCHKAGIPQPVSNFSNKRTQCRVCEAQKMVEYRLRLKKRKYIFYQPTVI